MTMPDVGEVVSYRRTPYVTGVELMTAENTSRNWKFCCHAYGVVLCRGWSAVVRYGGREVALGDERLFCGMPGEVISTKRVLRSAVSPIRVTSSAASSASSA